jgi:hypothetical protein
LISMNNKRAKSKCEFFAGSNLTSAAPRGVQDQNCSAKQTVDCNKEVYFQPANANFCNFKLLKDTGQSSRQQTLRTNKLPR